MAAQGSACRVIRKIGQHDKATLFVVTNNGGTKRVRNALTIEPRISDIVTARLMRCLPVSGTSVLCVEQRSIFRFITKIIKATTFPKETATTASRICKCCVESVMDDCTAQLRGGHANMFGALIAERQNANIMHTGVVRVVISEQKGRRRYSPLQDESLGSSVDEIWFADLPTQTERAAIFEIHIKKRGRDPKKFNIGKLAMLADQFSGAEIEEAIKSAMFDAFDDDKEVTTEHIVRAVETSPPLAQTAPEKIKKVRDACDANKWRRSTEIVERAATGRKIEA
jgi:hypothetical protein